VLLPRLVTCCNEYFVSKFSFVSLKFVNKYLFLKRVLKKSSLSFKMTLDVLRAARRAWVSMSGGGMRVKPRFTLLLIPLRFALWHFLPTGHSAPPSLSTFHRLTATT
jgi:hypothetical protein